MPGEHLVPYFGLLPAEKSRAFMAMHTVPFYSSNSFLVPFKNWVILKLPLCGANYGLAIFFHQGHVMLNLVAASEHSSATLFILHRYMYRMRAIAL